MNDVIAIDGPAASGKSSVARALAARLGWNFVNSGAVYRAFTWAVLQNGTDPADESAVEAVAGELEVTGGLEDGESWVAARGARLGPELDAPETNRAVSLVARVPVIRERAVEQLRGHAMSGPLVMEGRDIGTVVFPDAPWKFYIDASEEVRQSRRAAQGLVDQVAERDRVDSSRKTAPLAVADGAVVIDSSNLDINGVVAAILDHMRAGGFVAAGEAGA